MTFSGTEEPAERQAISFPEWKQALNAAALAPAQRTAYAREIMAFLHHCKVRRTPATIALARLYLTAGERRDPGAAREALRWFFRRGRVGPSAPVGNSPEAERAEPVEPTAGVSLVGGGAPGVSLTQPAGPPGYLRATEPVPAAQDRGGANWERDLISAVRRKGFLWRTEQTYREWAARFARFISPRSPYAVAESEVGAFLSALAVERRASQSTQKQALRVNGFANAVHRRKCNSDVLRLRALFGV